MKSAALLDGDERVVEELIKLLESNGYVVHVFTTSREKAEAMAKRTSANIYLVDPETMESRIRRVLDLNDVEIAAAMSPSDPLNLAFAKLMREAGVPKVLAIIRSGELARLAKELYGVSVMELDSCLVERVSETLNLQFAKIRRVGEDVVVGEVRITADSRLIGKSVEEVEEEFNVAVLVARDGRLIRSGELQEGDVIYVIGRRGDVERLANE